MKKSSCTCYFNGTCQCIDFFADFSVSRTQTFLSLGAAAPPCPLATAPDPVIIYPTPFFEAVLESFARLCFLTRKFLICSSYGSGFIFTTALPPDKVAAALTSIEILKAEEGRQLRKQHQENVGYVRNQLLRRGFPVEYAPSHIIPILVGLCGIGSLETYLSGRCFLQIHIFS